ncbi:hypothetical protein [Phyllobacterium sp. 22552]|uniref:hypothetical protein n=1 Tax=Phyllobacterium sp. 22552 TaxID=3453941 RepID=UPI003F866F76
MSKIRKALLIGPEKIATILQSAAASQIDSISKSHLQDYLQYYISLDRPGYAVLVTGEWGTGKTFQVTNSLSAEKYYYVSLFGIQSVEQLHAEVLAAAFPTLDKAGKFFNWVGETSKDVGGIFALGGAAPGAFNALFRRELKPERALIFDDLERSNLQLADVLGGINFYVEQQGFQVIVIAHDEKLANGFLSMREKTFGQAIRIEPQINLAFESFVTGLKSTSGATFVRTHQDTILGIFAESRERSLRILRHLIEDLDRLHRALTMEHLAHEPAMRHLVKLFSAFNIEMRTGNLSETNLRNRKNARLNAAIRSRGKTDAEEVDPLVVADTKFKEIDLEDGLLNDHVLIAMFVDGRYEPNEIRRSLDNSVYFLRPSEVSPWKVVINFDELDDEVIGKAVDEMDVQFAERSVTDTGELLHIFALRLMMADNGIIKRSLEEELRACKDYIDDLLKDNRLPARPTRWDWRSSFNNGYDGYGYWITENARPSFTKIHEYLMEAREQALTNTFPAIREHLLKTMSHDSKAVFEMISPTNNGENPYAHIALLHGIAPAAFVDAWLSAPIDQWRMIQYALQNRYEHERINRDLSVERDWARSVHQELLDRAEAATGFASLRIRRLIPSVLRGLTENADS